MSDRDTNEDASAQNGDLFDGRSGGPESESERGLSDAARGRLDRQRSELSHQVGGAAGEIERLRMKQAELEREKQELQQLARKQEDYERGKREMTEKLSRSVVLLEKEREQAVRMAELLAETRERFAEQLTALERIREDEWVDGDFKEELESALAEVDAAKTIYKKALARIEASSWHKSAGSNAAAGPLEPTAEGGAVLPRGFGFWLKAGLAFSLPIAAVLIVLFLISMYWQWSFNL